uniref:Saposin B-type domain-containing protein n=1 Tax=Plectus sambesii TaxID=2011161 RepID=A0A914WLL6_9BILA
MHFTSLCFLLLSTFVLGATALPLDKAPETKSAIDCLICHLFVEEVQGNAGMSLNDCETKSIAACHQLMGPFGSECDAFIHANGPHLYQAIHSGGANGICNQWC